MELTTGTASSLSFDTRETVSNVFIVLGGNKTINALLACGTIGTLTSP